MITIIVGPSNNEELMQHIRAAISRDPADLAAARDIEKWCQKASPAELEAVMEALTKNANLSLEDRRKLTLLSQIHPCLEPADVDQDFSNLLSNLVSRSQDS